MRMILCAMLCAIFVPALVGAEEGDYVIGDGDVLGISVWGEQTFSKSIMVRPDGKITLPALGDLVATGSTPEELSEILEKELTKFVKVPIVTVTVTGIQNSKVYVIGGGPGTGIHHLPGRTTLLKFLASLGSLQAGNLRKAYLLRNGERIMTDFYDLFFNGELGLDVAVKPGDILFIPDNTDNKIYVMGAVNNPTYLVYREDISVLEAILEVGGFTQFAHRDKVFILRQEKEGMIKIKANVEEVMKNADLSENITLEKGDFVVVKEGIF